MKFPQTPSELKSEILILLTKQNELGDLRLRQLINILAKVDHDLIVEGVIQIFEMHGRSNVFQDQEFAGRILERINPKSAIDFSLFLKRTLLNWDRSVEQLPFWFRNNYGIDLVKATFDQEELSNEEKDKLRTMKFWLGLL